jgi:probable F420-dependent oxidoreductase
MKVSLHFGNMAFPDAAGARRLVLAAERAGFESVMAIEHVIWPTDYASTYPYSPTGKLPGGPATPLPDPLIWMAYLGGITTKLRFMTGILILPQRNPLVLAKEIATLDHLTGGRISLGVGIGWLKEEFEALGVPFEKRGLRTDETIAAMRAVWAEDDASYSGELIRFRNVSCNPKPANGTVPFIIGGHSEAAARRAGRLGDGFFPATGAQVDIAPLIALMRRTASEAGRDPNTIEVTTGCPGALPKPGNDPLGAIADAAKRGVGRIALPVNAFMPDLEASLQEYGEKVLKQVGD